MAKKRTVMALNRPAAATLHSPHLAKIHLQLKLASCLFEEVGIYFSSVVSEESYSIYYIHKYQRQGS